MSADKAWRRFAWRLVALSAATGAALLPLALLHNNVAVGVLSGYYLSSAMWMALWTVVDR